MAKLVTRKGDSIALYVHSLSSSFCVNVARYRQRALQWTDSPTLKSYYMSKQQDLEKLKIVSFLYRGTLHHIHSSNIHIETAKQKSCMCLWMSVQTVFQFLSAFVSESWKRLFLVICVFPNDAACRILNVQLRNSNEWESCVLCFEGSCIQ